MQVFGIDYALVTRTVNRQPFDTRLVQINPNGGGVADRSRVLAGADWQDGNETQISGYQSPDNWVYIVADGFARDHPCGCIAARGDFHRPQHVVGLGSIGDGPDWGWDRPRPLSTVTDGASLACA